MRFRITACLCALALVAGCSGGGPTASDGRTTETFTLTTTRLLASGGMSYPVDSPVPTFTVDETGIVDATASFSTVVDCEFVFGIEPTSSSGNYVLQSRGRSQMLSIQGELTAGSYNAVVTAREGGMSLCAGVPEEGVLFPQTIVITHP